MASQSWPSTALAGPPRRIRFSARASFMYGARSSRFSPAHQAQRAAPNRSSFWKYRVSAQTIGISTCIRLPPRIVMNRPNGEKMMCPASWNTRLIMWRNDPPTSSIGAVTRVSDQMAIAAITPRRPSFPALISICP